jgi:hypothetical protein
MTKVAVQKLSIQPKTYASCAAYTASRRVVSVFFVALYCVIDMSTRLDCPSQVTHVLEVLATPTPQTYAV